MAVNMKASRKLWMLGLGAITTLCALTVPARADIIVSDQFNDGDINNDGTTDGVAATGADTRDIPWMLVNTSTTTLAATSVSGNNALSVNYPNASGRTRQYIGTLYSQTGQTSRASASSVTVGVGQTLRLSFSLTIDANVADDTGTVLRFGLYNSNGTLATGSGATNSVDDYGYLVTIGSGSSTGSFGSKKETGTGSSTEILVGNDVSNYDTTSTPTAFSIANTGGTYSFVMELSRIESDKMAVNLSVNGNSILSFTDASGIYTTFDEIAFSNGAAADGDHSLDNVQLTLVPEPAAAGMLAIPAVAMLYRKKRR